MRHFLLIDPLEKLNIKKDSSLLLALTLQERGIETFLFFQKDFSINNTSSQRLKVYKFKGHKKNESVYLNDFQITDSFLIDLNTSDVIHMRLDPPVDGRYLRVLWMLDHLSSSGIRVLNNPRGIMNFNEKLYAYRTEGAVPSFVGESLDLAKDFLESLNLTTDVILKPLDLYSGIGVEKLSKYNWEQRFQEKVRELNGPVVLQPFKSEVENGEMRAIYFKEQEIGTILKVPREGEFLSNIAQGASFYKVELSVAMKIKCEKIALELSSFGVDWIAFDILGEAITEVNITCPGLLVEVSHAYGENLSHKIIDLMI
jgi:glutathione synthase